MSREQVLAAFAGFVRATIAPRAEPSHWPPNDVGQAAKWQVMLEEARCAYRAIRRGHPARQVLERYRDDVLTTEAEHRALSRIISHLSPED